jgi:hypothetical protein
MGPALPTQVEHCLTSIHFLMQSSQNDAAEPSLRHSINGTSGKAP